MTRTMRVNISLAAVAVLYSFTFVAPAKARDDLIWQNTNGTVLYWSIDRGVRIGSFNVGGTGPVGAEWTLRAAGDLNSDGTDDLIWQHSNGQVHWWAIRAGLRTGGGDIGSSGPIGGEWTLVGSGDLNGDGTDDIVWRHTSGQMHWWAIRNGVRLSGADIGASGPIGPEWRVRGVGDLNGDGTDDIVWQHTIGQMHWWAIRNGTRVSGGDIRASGPIGPEWAVRGVGDMDGDGTDDIVWQYSNGYVHYWGIRDGTRFSGSDIGAAGAPIGPVGREWSLRAVGNIGGNEPTGNTGPTPPR